MKYKLRKAHEQDRVHLGSVARTLEERTGECEIFEGPRDAIVTYHFCLQVHTDLPKSSISPLSIHHDS
jgi:hypothetical protein